MLRIATLAGAGLAALFLAAPAQAKQTGCLAVSKIAEPDIRHNRKALKDTCIRRKTIREAGRTWQIYTISQDWPGPLWAVLHDNEHAAFDASVTGLKRHGGTIVAVEANERRIFQGKDPNRNFGKKCGRATQYTRFIMDLAEKHGRVIAMHSNARGFRGDGKGGKGNINVYRKSKVLQGRPTRRAKGAFRSGDNFVLVPAKTEKSVRGRIAALHKRGVHAMYERVTRKGNDCSMSNHAVLTGFTEYVNVEVRHGQVKTARRLVEKAMAVFK